MKESYEKEAIKNADKRFWRLERRPSRFPTAKYEYIIVPAFKFVVAFLLILVINNHIGFNLGLTTSLGSDHRSICTLVPVNFMAGIMVILVPGPPVHALTRDDDPFCGRHLSADVPAVFPLLSPKDTFVILLLPLAFAVKVEYAIPVIAGLLSSRPAARWGGLRSDHRQVSVLCGAEQGGPRKQRDRSCHRRQFQEYCRCVAPEQVHVDHGGGFRGGHDRCPLHQEGLRRPTHGRLRSLSEPWSNSLSFSLFGDMQYFNTNIDLTKVFIGVFFSILVKQQVQLCFMVDGTRIESVQFEDDDYYYYVKAVPGGGKVTGGSKVGFPCAR